MHAFPLKLLLATALGWVAPISAQHRDSPSERCTDSRAALVAASPGRVIETALYEPRQQALLP